MTTQFWLAFAAYLLPTFPLGYFWHLKTFAKAYEALEIYRPQPIIPMGLASMVIQGLIFAWIFPRVFDTTAPWLGNAVKYFVVFGLLSWSMQVLPVAAKNRMASMPSFLKLETAFTALHFAVTGLLIAFVYRGGA